MKTSKEVSLNDEEQSAVVTEHSSSIGNYWPQLQNYYSAVERDLWCMSEGSIAENGV